jgi:hypothetical protein
LGRSSRAAISGHHSPPSSFRAGQTVQLELVLQKPPQAVHLFYRHVNQGERFEKLLMQADGNSFRAAIPAAYTDSPYPLQYYFQVRHDSQNASLYPGFASPLANQPYYLLRQS